jgi:hypothetical protein
LANVALGAYSFAAGRNARTYSPGFPPGLHDGAFVYADSSTPEFRSTASNQYSVRATGGVRLVLAIDGGDSPTWTCAVESGGSWACSSDRAQKQNLLRLDGREILSRLATLPVYEWNPRGANAHVRHFGPTAQDFHAAFGLGESALRIGQQDADGIALAAIQGLHDELRERDRRLADQAALLQQLAARLEALERHAAR